MLHISKIQLFMFIILHPRVAQSDKQKIEANSKHLEPISDRGYELIHEPKTRDNSNKRKNQLKQQQNPSSSSYK